MNTVPSHEIEQTSSADRALALRIDALRRSAIVALAAVVVGAAVGWLIVHSVGTVRWQAIALVQVGQVGVWSGVPGVMPVEPVARALERARSPSFVQSLIARLGLPTDEQTLDPGAQAVRRTLRVANPRNSDLLEFQVVRGDADAAAKTLSEAVAQLAASCHSPGCSARWASPTVSPRAWRSPAR